MENSAGKSPCVVVSEFLGLRQPVKSERPSDGATRSALNECNQACEMFQKGPMCLRNGRDITTSEDSASRFLRLLPRMESEVTELSSASSNSWMLSLNVSYVKRVCAVDAVINRCNIRCRSQKGRKRWMYCRDGEPSIYHAKSVLMYIFLIKYNFIPMNW